jgi:hypothetical protein
VKKQVMEFPTLSKLKTTFPNLSKGFVLMGASMAVVALGSSAMHRLRAPAASFTELTSLQNATLAQNNALYNALVRVADYTLDNHNVHTDVLKAVAELMLIGDNNPSTILVRNAEVYVQELRVITARRTRNNSSVMEEFDEVSHSVLGACDDKLFNLHQAYTVHS